MVMAGAGISAEQLLAAAMKKGYQPGVHCARDTAAVDLVQYTKKTLRDQEVALKSYEL